MIVKETGILFLIERDGEWTWYKNGDEEKDIKYVGEFKDGIPNGQGTFTWKNGHKYVGEWKDGRFIKYLVFFLNYPTLITITIISFKIIHGF